MASNIDEDKSLKFTITDVPSGSFNEETATEYAPFTSSFTTATHSETAKVVDVDENLKTGSINLGYSSWWGSLVKTAKEKSQAALELIKNDLAEFKTTMASDTNTLLTQITNINIAENINPMLTNLNKTFSTSENDGSGGLFELSSSSSNKDSKQAASSSSNSSIYDRYLNELRLLQSSQNTYLQDPSDEALFAEFKTDFVSDSYKSDISDLLIENSQMRLLFSQLVIVCCPFYFRFLFIHLKIRLFFQKIRYLHSFQITCFGPDISLK